MLVCICRAGSEMHTAGCAAQGGDAGDAISRAGNTPRCSVSVFVQTGRFFHESMREGEWIPPGGVQPGWGLVDTESWNSVGMDLEGHPLVLLPGMFTSLQGSGVNAEGHGCEFLC